jgi:hypothetical protein
LATEITSCNFRVVSWTCGCSTSVGAPAYSVPKGILVRFWSWWVTFRSLTDTSQQSRTRFLVM